MSFGYHTKYESRAAGHVNYFSSDNFMSSSQQPMLPYQRQYKTDGTGRDTYIAFDNGGFNTPFQPYRAADIGTFGGGKGKSKFFNRTQSKPTFKIVNYNLDGTGRDTYIKNSNGGFFPEKTSTQGGRLGQTFFDKLRSYDRPITAMYLEKRKKKTVKLSSDGRLVPDSDFLTKTQNFVSHQHNLEQRQTASYLQEQCDRLSQPKLKILIQNGGYFGSGRNSVQLSVSRNCMTADTTPTNVMTMESKNQSLSRNAPKFSGFGTLTSQDARRTGVTQSISNFENQVIQFNQSLSSTPSQATNTKLKISKRLRQNYPPLHSSLVGQLKKQLSTANKATVA